MTPTFRSWIVFFHRWIGFPIGIGLFILFATGSLAVFSLEIQQWMQPQTSLSSFQNMKGLDQAGEMLARAHHNEQNTFLRIPLPRDPVFRLWHYDGHTFRGPALNPTTGEVLPARDVVGGTFFVTLHDCFYMPNFWGRVLVCLAGLGFIVALLTGVMLQYRRFFSDFLLFRPRAAPHRFWLDTHLLIGTLGLPILLIIGLSGTILQLQKLTFSFGSPHSRTVTPPPKPTPLPSTTLSNLQQQGNLLWGTTQGGFFMPLGKETYLFQPDNMHFCITRSHISATHPLPEEPSSCPSLKSFLTGVHNIRWAGFTVRWLYFAVGVAGSVLMASGLILFQRTEHRRLSHNTRSSRLALQIINSLNIGTIIGLPIASLGLLWSTRLPEWHNMMPVTWETAIFFSLWGGSFAHALVHARALHVQSIILTVLGLGLLPIDMVTRPLTTNLTLFLSIDLCGTAIGLLATFVSHRTYFS